MHKITTRILAPCAAFIAVALIFMAPTAFSQEDMVEIPTSAFDSPERPVVKFEHDKHNELAELDDCVICHHGKTDNGQMDIENSSEGESCDSCHSVKPKDGTTPLMRAYHLQCTTCHEKSLKGPVVCGECHKN
jgi:hypothetical protein